MSEHAATLQLIGVTVLAVTAVAWAVILTSLLRRTGGVLSGRRPAAPLPALPRQSRVGPPLESVELTPAERAAFAGLVRRLGHR
ncbi:hypothetical protein [Streptomyces sp. NK08204]|uniref:hypothetical protein n=1 Tax=Streptomyces sp. NK08204 TaxID=2873260 RepID=UPI001CED737B|nr:hypothetical protein [Streptomyces sp. NK08204]